MAHSQSQSHKDTLAALLNAQNNYKLSIITLSEQVSPGPAKKQLSGERTSDVSADDLLDATPAKLEEDLAHYKDLFSKLRFSYSEQVTKEKFIRAIVGDPPLVVEHQENVELERSLAMSKAALKAQKIEVEDLVKELEQRGRELCHKYEHIQTQTAQLRVLPERIDGLQAVIEELHAAQQPGSDPSLNMPLERTLETVEARDRERAEFERQIEQLQALLPRKTREMDRLNVELQPLEVKKLGSAAAAREAQRRKEEALGGIADDLEERGRWFRGVEIGLKAMLDVES